MTVPLPVLQLDGDSYKSAAVVKIIHASSRALARYDIKMHGILLIAIVCVIAPRLAFFLSMLLKVDAFYFNIGCISSFFYYFSCICIGCVHQTLFKEIWKENFQQSPFFHLQATSTYGHNEMVVSYQNISNID